MVPNIVITFEKWVTPGPDFYSEITFHSATSNLPNSSPTTAFCSQDADLWMKQKKLVGHFLPQIPSFTVPIGGRSQGYSRLLVSPPRTASFHLLNIACLYGRKWVLGFAVPLPSEQFPHAERLWISDWLLKKNKGKFQEEPENKAAYLENWHKHRYRGAKPTRSEKNAEIFASRQDFHQSFMLALGISRHNSVGNAYVRIQKQTIYS